MMARRGFFGLLASAAAAVLAGCARRTSFRYKMVVEVDTPQGIRRGEAVREVVTRDPPPIPALGESRTQVSVKGEAVAVDLPDGWTLFALLKGANGRVDYASQDIKTLFREFGAGVPNDVVELWPAMPRTQRPQIGNPLPMLVVFSDTRDPTSVRLVEPDDLMASVGPGVKLKRIMVVSTGEPTTTGIVKRLGWLNDYYAKRFDGQRFGDGTSLANDLSSGAFSTEPNQ